MAEIRIPVEKLPPPDKNGDHAFQFRIISVDKNQWSAWSQLYIVKSIGQYRPLESDVTAIISTDEITVTWDTPTIYNYNSASITSASIAHNHSQNFKQHATDIFIKYGYQFLDLSFLENTGNGSGSVSGEFVNRILLQPDEKMLVAGNFSTWNSSSARHIVRLNSDGTRDTVFSSNVGTAGGGAFNGVYDLSIQTDGKILVAGSFGSWNGTSSKNIVRLNSNGTTDTAFSSNIGTGASSAVQTISIQQDGKIVIGGGFDTWNGVSVGGIVRLNSDGTRDTAFSSNVGTGYLTSTNEFIVKVLVQQDGKIIIAGWFDKWNGVSVGRIVRLNSDGTRDTAFSSNVGTGATTIREAIIQPDGKIIVSIVGSTWNGQPSKRIFRLNENGTKDISFSDIFISSGPYSLSLQEDGKILLGGAFSIFGQKSVGGIVRLNQNGTLDEYFYTNSGTGAISQDGSKGTILAIQVQQDGKIIVGGSFDYWDGVSSPGIARLNNLNNKNSNFQYHERSEDDSTSILIEPGSASVRVLGLVALKDIPRKNTFEEDSEYQIRLDSYLGISGSVQGVFDLFKVFDTQVVQLTT